MRPEDAQELIGQRRVWVADTKARGPTQTVVTCTHAEGTVRIDTVRIDAVNSRITIDQVWCSYRLANGNTDVVWFTPDKFKSFSVSESARNE